MRTPIWATVSPAAANRIAAVRAGGVSGRFEARVVAGLVEHELFGRSWAASAMMVVVNETTCRPSAGR